VHARAFAAADAERWDAFCADAINATFLHTRRFLSYHGERFVDRSLVLEDESGRWLGVLPAAVDPDDAGVVVSHPGITYGGVLHQGALRGEAMLDAVVAAARCWREGHGHRALRYKAVRGSITAHRPRTTSTRCSGSTRRACAATSRAASTWRIRSR
jgi:hypothetical protein